MTLDEILSYKGHPKNFDKYSTLLDKKKKLEKQISKLSDNIQDEDASLSVFEGELTDHDKELFNRHVETRKGLVTKRNKKQKEWELTIKRLQDLQKEV